MAASMTPAEVVESLDSEAVSHLGRSRVEAVVSSALLPSKITGAYLWDTLVDAFGKRVDWHLVAMMAALEDVQYPVPLGQPTVLVEVDVKANVSPAQLLRSIRRVAGMTEAERNRVAEFLAREQQNRDSARAYEKPKVRKAPPKYEKPYAARSRGSGWCKMQGCQSRGLTKYDGYCFACYQDI